MTHFLNTSLASHKGTGFAFLELFVDHGSLDEEAIKEELTEQTYEALTIPIEL